MEIPTYKHEIAVDFMRFVDNVSKKYGFDYRDMAGKWSAKNYKKFDRLKKQWAFNNGFGEAWQRVKDAPRCNKGDPEYADYIAIEQGWYHAEGAKLIDEIPYQDVWHWMIDNDFENLHKGSVYELYLGEDRFENENVPEYVKTVLRAIQTEVLDHPAFNKNDQSLACYIDW
jgi:hypothetical protein